MDGKQLLSVSEEEYVKLIRKVQKSTKEHIHALYLWRKMAREVKEKYNAFGVDVSNVLYIDDHKLFANFIALETKKTRNKKYRQFLLGLLDGSIEIEEKYWEPEKTEDKIAFGK